MANHPGSSTQDHNEVLQQTQRLLTWSAYQESLKEVDREVLQQFHLTISSLRSALWIKVGIYLLQFLVVSAALFFGLSQTLQAKPAEPWAWVVSLGCLLLLAILLMRNPIQSINHTLVDLARVQIILQGYTRQINQVDAIFKQAFLERTIGVRTVSKSLEQIQRVIDGNVESLLQFLEEMSS